MSPLVTAEIVISGICLAVGLLHLTIYLRRRELAADLFLAFMSLFTAAVAMLDAFLFNTRELLRFVALSRWQVSFQAALWISLIWFVVTYTGKTRRWLAWAATGGFAAAAMVHLISPWGLFFREIHVLGIAELPWGEPVAYLSGEPGVMRLVMDTSWLLMFWMTAESGFRLYRQGQRRQAAFLGCGLLLPAAVAYLHSALVHTGVISPPPMFSVAFLVLVLNMSVALTGDVVRDSRLTLDAAASERRWRTLMENIKRLVVGFDREKSINYVNPWFLEATGYTRSEVMGRRFLEFVTESERGAALEWFQRALSGRVRDHYRSVLVKKDGREIEVEWSSAAVTDSSDRPIGLLSIGEDLNSSADGAAPVKKLRAEAILSALDTPAALLDPDLNLVWVNEALRGLYPDEDPVGHKCYAFFENRNFPCEACGALKAFSDGSVHEREMRSFDNRWRHVVSTPIQGDGGGVAWVLESITDVTEQKAAVEAQERSLREVRMINERLEDENSALKALAPPVRGFRDIVGESRPLRDAVSSARKAAETDGPLLISGEPGVGKRLFAEAVHQAGARSHQPFVAVDCAAIPQERIESVLFGWKPEGPAIEDPSHIGRIALAAGGTLFLGGVDALPAAVQGQLLGICQGGGLQRSGRAGGMSPNVRVIASTGKDLAAEAAAGRFVPELFDCLNTASVLIPPLRERTGDLPLLVRHFIGIFSITWQKRIDDAPQPIMDVLAGYDWPGNVRELMTVIERAVMTSPGPALAIPGDFRQPQRTEASTGAPAGDEPLLPLEEAERRHILKALKSVSWRISGPNGAATLLKMNPSTLRNRMKKHGLKRP